MLEYKFYYWEVPFRGNFVEIFLAEVGAKYKRYDAPAMYPKKGLKAHHPGMAPPYLYDCKKKIHLAQMPAILVYLGKEYGYLPKKAEPLALAIKSINDAHDVLTEITQYYGMKMWDKKTWNEFRKKRLVHWMQIYEQTAKEQGLKVNKGFFLGSKISIADFATTALFGTMIYCLPELEKDLKKYAPFIYALVKRIEERLAIAAFLTKQRAEFGQIYCGGKIEQSLRKLLK